MVNILSDLEQRLIEAAERGCCEDAIATLLRDAAGSLGNCRRVMQREIDDNTGMSGWRLLAFQEVLNRMGAK